MQTSMMGGALAVAARSRVFAKGERPPNVVPVTHRPKPGWQSPESMGQMIYDPAYGRKAT